ncbi:MAG TPA: FecR domain-containing protein [Thermoanaerobaculaceae bacterium]|nr:FecR domain-containing protein [Thermoanaerobaculaceae bacterium]
MRSQTPSPPARRFELDWVVVSVSGIKRWGLLIFLLVLAACIVGGVLYFMHEPAEARAQRALRRASAAQEEIQRSGVSDSLAAEFDQASHLLDEARSDWDRKDYPACIARAEDSLQRFQLLGGLTNREFAGSGQIIALHGKVEVQRANQTKWEKGREKQPLYNGDFVKTGSDAYAEVLFSDSTVYKVGPDSLLEVHREARGGRRPTSPEVKIKTGQVNVYTASNTSSVVTDAARADIDRDSRVGVEVADDTSTVVSAYSGKAHVTGATGDQVELSTRQAVSAAPGGKLGQQRAVPEAPTLEKPPVNYLANLDLSDRVELKWRDVAGCTGYELQVSRSRLFAASSLEFSVRRTTNGAVVKILRPGTYFWRAAALGTDRVRSEWSSPRAFKAFAGPRVEALTDTTPPKLEVQKPTQMGNFFIIQGVTVPGATVTVNGEPVEVEGDGTFKKAVALNREGWNTIVIRATDPAGNTAEDRKSVYVEVE